MKKFLMVLLIIYSAGCAPTTMITGSWKSPALSSKNLNSILVATLTSNTIAKSVLEKDITDLLNQKGIKTYLSIEMFPPDVSNSDSDRVIIMQKVKGKNIDAILTIALLRTGTESRYVDSSSPYDPAGRFGYYRNFWGYYSYWYPYAYDPQYYTETVYYIETNLYDVASEDLLWSVQSKAYDIGNLQKFSKEFAGTIVNKLTTDGIVKKDLSSEK
jgi:hypothetical protein